jgi:hypothetical protein
VPSRCPPKKPIIPGLTMPGTSSRCCSRKRPQVSMIIAQAISRCCVCKDHASAYLEMPKSTTANPAGSACGRKAVFRRSEHGPKYGQIAFSADCAMCSTLRRGWLIRRDAVCAPPPRCVRGRLLAGRGEPANRCWGLGCSDRARDMRPASGGQINKLRERRMAAQLFRCSAVTHRRVLGALFLAGGMRAQSRGVVVRANLARLDVD